jgi:3-hydroxybutyryl-CoA dehydratase
MLLCKGIIMTPRTLYFQDLTLGLEEKQLNIVKYSDIQAFAEVSGDKNPIHLDEDFAATTQFGEIISHGMLTASYISAIIGMRLPGPGCIYLSQSLKFLAPVMVADEVQTHVRVISLNEEKNRATLACVCTVKDKIVLEGEALVKVPSKIYAPPSA